MSPTPFSELISLTPNEDHFTAHVSDDWLQGRSTFGGLSAALCLEAALKTFPSLPPLRSAQITFIGPVAGDIQLHTNILRQGRNVTYAEVSMITDTGLATKCLFCFGARRDSILQRDSLEKPSFKSPEKSSHLFPEGRGPIFTQHLEQRLVSGALPVSNSGTADNTAWVRLKDWQSRDDIVSLIAVADGLPPAEMSSFATPAPISTMTWMINFLASPPSTKNGWWLLRTKASHTENGYSSQSMQGWNSDGQIVFDATQLVALFI